MLAWVTLFWNFEIKFKKEQVAPTRTEISFSQKAAIAAWVLRVDGGIIVIKIILNLGNRMIY